MIKQEKIKILYVDDEVNNLNGFKASFRMDYTVLIAANTDEAKVHLAANPDIRIILSDQRMPDKTGVQFFEEIRNEYPNPIRILITGYTDIESVIDAINRGHIYRYIKKPWTDIDIQSAIDGANKFFLANSMLAVKNQELQRAYDELDKFAYSVTHDMRGPLLSMLGAMEVVRNMDDINEVRGMLQMMETNLKKLDSFIISVHDYYNLKRGQLNVAEIDFTSLVKDMVDFFSITGKIDNTTLQTKVMQEKPFRGDEVSIKMIVNNLLSNAYKYQRRNITEKFVSLDVEVTDNRVKITVTDNGIGIDDKHIKDIFNMFYRATSEETGSGFGLYNVKDAVTKLGGEINVISKPGEGSTFTVVIPGK